MHKRVDDLAMWLLVLLMAFGVAAFIALALTLFAPVMQGIPK